MADKKSKSEIYLKILDKKDNLTVLKNKGFNFLFPKKAFDRICKFYGFESLKPISFVHFVKNISTSEIKKMGTVSRALGDREIANILDVSECFAIIPKDYHEKYDEVKISEISPKIKTNIMKDILKKADIEWDLLVDFCEIQIISTQIEETTKVTVNYELVENVFKYIPLLKIIFVNGEKVDFTYYSYKKVLENCGIKLENMIPYLHPEIKKMDRNEIFNKIYPLYERVQLREIKDRVDHGDLKDKNVDIHIGLDRCKGFKMIPFDEVENNGKEASDLLNDLMNKVNNKKNNIKNYYENIDNQIIEIKDKDNKNVYIRRKIFDEIISDPDEDFDEYKTHDINGNEIILSKKDLPDYNNNPTLIKIYNKNKPKEDFIYNDINDISENLNNFNYFRQKIPFKGKNKNDEEKEEEWVVMDVETGDLPELDESKPLYTIPEKEKLHEKTKNDLLDELKNKDILLYNKNNNFVPINTINDIKKRDKNVKNKNIKYKLKNQINPKDNILVEYKDVFDEEKSPELIIINNEDTPDENIVVNKNDLLNELNNWDDLNNNIKINNNVNNNELEINPKKIKIKKLEKDEIPKNYEDIQEEIKKSITPDNTIIKTKDNNLIKKPLVQKIINNNDPDYDIYYIKDINDKKIKVSRKELEKDDEDPSCQFISTSTKENPDKMIIVPTPEIITQLDLDPMDENISVNDKDGNNNTLKKPSIKINPLEIEEINFDEQPNKIKSNIIKDVKDYYYLYKDPENKPHYVRGDTLNIVKNYKSPYPIENFEVEDDKDNKFMIPKESALQIINNPNEIKYINLDDKEKNEPVMADVDMFKNGEGDIDDEIPVNKDSKKIKLKNIKLKKLKDIDSIGEQPEEKEYEIIYDLIKKLQKDNPSSDIYKAKDNQNKDILIYEDTLNKIEENKNDPEKTTYKGNSPLKEEIICGKNTKKNSPNKYIKLVEPNIIVDKNELEKILKEYKPSQKSIKIKDIKNNPNDLDPLKIQVYEASPEETDITKILPADFSDINERLLLDIVPQNKLILTNDNDNKPTIIKKKEGDNLIKYPKTTFDTFVLYDKDGKKIKTSRKNAEKNVNDKNCEFIEILDNTNCENKNEIVPVNELVKALKDKENEDFEINNKDGKKIKLNKKKISIVKQNNKYTEVPEQGEEIKNKLLSEIIDPFIKTKDSKDNKDILLRNSQLNEINNHKQRAPFINYEVLNDKKEKVHTTKDICKQILSDPKNEKLVLCYDDSQKNREFLVPIENIKNAKCDGDDEFEIGNNEKVIFKNLKVKKLNDAPKLGIQPEEEKMIKIINLINKINSGPLNKNYKTKDIEGNPCFVSNNYINKLQKESKSDQKDTKYKINDAFGKNKITLTKKIVENDNKPGEYIIIKNKKDNNDYLVDLNDLLNNLKKFKSTDDDIILTNSLDNKNIKLNPLDIEIIPPYNNYPLQKVFPKIIIPDKKDENKDDDNLKINKEKEKGKPEERKNKNEDLDIGEEIKERIRLRSAPARHHIPPKKSYKIRRAIIYKKQKKDN